MQEVGGPHLIARTNFFGWSIQGRRSVLESFVSVDGLVHVASADAISKHDFGIAVAEVFGLDASLITPEAAPPTGVQGLFRSRDISLDTTHLASLLGHAPPTQVDGLIAARGDEHTLGVALRAMDDEA